MDGEVHGAPTAVTEQLVAWLRSTGVAFQLLAHAPTRTSEEAAAVRGTALGSGAKALVLYADAQPIHVVLAADLRVDGGRLRGILGARKLRFATPDELLALTGCPPGAVPPFAHLFGLPGLVDEGLRARREVAFNAGSTHVSVIMGGPDYLRLCGARLCRLARPRAHPDGPA